jgi:amino acid adenylation domain-containing protein
MRLSDFSLWASDDEQIDSCALLRRVNETATSYPRDRTIPAIFAEQAAKLPDAVAIVHGDTALSYRETERRSNQLAQFLLARGLEQEHVVAIMLDRSAGTIVAMLATLKAGGAYCPIGRDLPFERIRQILADSRVTVLIGAWSQRELGRRLRAQCPDLATVLFVDDGDVCIADDAASHGEWSMAVLDACSGDDRIDRGHPRSMAYVIYTSGTTGVPKGVVVEHRSVLRLVLNTNVISLSPDDCILQTGSLAFDASTFEIWGALLNGGRVCLADQEILLRATEMQHLIRRHRVTTMWLTASLFNMLATDHCAIFAGLDTVLVGGEKLSTHHCNLVRRAYPGIVLKNGYGPTENTTFTTCYTLEEDADGDIPIGAPISNTTVHILDEQLEPVDIGVSGELYTGGDGLARGYLNAPALTAEKFVPHRLAAAGGRLYRTGDLARWRADGQIEFIGRADDEIKIRGYRVELAEIEHQLIAAREIKNAVVIAKMAADGLPRLAAYYTTDDVSVASGRLHDHLAQVLPEYMIPTQFIRLDALPLTAHGKLDRRALPDPGGADILRQRTLPSNETERELLAIWRTVLKVDDAGIDDDFFALGGHSLTAVRLVNAIANKFGAMLPFAAVLQAPTVRALAGVLLDSAQFGHPAVDRPLVLLNGPLDGAALFAFPPGTADALSYSLLAKHLPAWPVHAFNFIEEVGFEAYADHIAQVVGDDPCYLFGYSGGGNLAFRVAKELENRGRRVAAIIMLDSSRFLRPFPISVQEARRLAAEFLGTEEVSSIVPSALLRDKVVRKIERYYASLSTTPDDGMVAADIHVIVSENSADTFYDGAGRLVCSKSAWAEATRGHFRIHQGLGDHQYMLHQNHIDANAQLLRDILESVVARAQP